MKTHFKKKSTEKAQQMAAAHSVNRTSKNEGVSLEDNRASTTIQQKQISAIQSNIPIQTKKNNTGLPDNLKSGMESISGHSMDDVKVHYNSSKPAQLNAHAYAQGTNIHLGSGQEKHLPHEAWHVVQQKQGRVKPTLQTKGVAINDDKGLEKEADVMGAKALQRKGILQRHIKNHTAIQSTVQLAKGKKQRAEEKAAKALNAKKRAEKRQEDAGTYELASAGKTRNANRIRKRQEKKALMKAREDCQIDKHKEHILNRHSLNRKQTEKNKGKTKFPKKWSDTKIIAEVMHVIMDKTNPIKEDAKYGPSVLGMAGGIEIEVYFLPRKPSAPADAPLIVSTAYPKDHNYVPPKK